MISAWINSKMERDKQLLGLSASGIGLLVTLLRTVGASNKLQIVCFCLALICFLITVILVICILDQNSKHIEEILNNSKTQESKVLQYLDHIAAISFVVAMVSIIIIGFSISLSNLSEKENTMSKEQQNNNQAKFTKTENDVSEFSLNGIANLRPQSPEVSVDINNDSDVLNYAITSEINQDENNTSASDSNNSA